MKTISLRTLLAIAGVVTAAQAGAQVTFYQGNDFRGPNFTADQPVTDFERYGFNDRAASAVVQSGRWEVCEHSEFRGRCVVLRPGDYPDLSPFGLNRQISSARMVAEERVARDDRGDAARRGYEDRRGYDDRIATDERRGYDEPRGYATRDQEFRRGRNERVFEVPVTRVRAVVTQASQQRCWTERQEVNTGGDNRGAGIAGAVVGGVLGGIIGHQFGNGRGNDVATGAGAVGGALLGSNVARNNSGGGNVTTQDVQRCEETRGDARPDYYEVAYNFRGVEHRVQMTSPPGSTITVSEDGEPRI